MSAGSRRVQGLARGPWPALVAALLLRVGIALLGGDHPPVSDGAHFDRIAHSLLEGRGFGEHPSHPTSHRAPLQAWVLALLRGLAPEGNRPGALFGAALGALLVLPVYALARRVAGDRAAALAAWGAALYPRFIDYSVRLWSLSEGVAVVLLTCALAAWAGAEEHGSRRAALLSGVCLGLVTLARPVYLLFPFLLLLRGGEARRRPAILAALTAAALVLLPWTLRNWVMWGRFIPVSTMTGIVFYQGFHPPDEGWGYTPWEEIRRATAGVSGGEPAVSDALIRITLRDIAAAPQRALGLLPRKLIGLFHPFEEQGSRLDVGFLAVVLLGALAGRRLLMAEAFRVPLLSVCYAVFFALVFYGSPRFRLPMEPVLLVAAAATAARWSGTREGRLRLVVLSALLAGLRLLPGLDREGVKRWLGQTAPARTPAPPDSGT